MKSLFDVDVAVIAALVKRAGKHRTLVDGVLEAVKEEHAKTVRASQQKVEEAERIAKDAVREEDFLCFALLLRGCLTPSFIELWLRVHGLEKKVLRTDLLVKTIEKAKTDLVEARKALIAECDHPVVLREDGYGGSHINDYSDSHTGRAVCVMCGYSAYDSDCKDTNIHLPPEPNRVIARYVNDPGCDIGYDACKKRGLDGHVRAYREMATPQLALERFFGKKRIARLLARIAELADGPAAPQEADATTA